MPSSTRAVWLVLAGILSVQVGAGLSKQLFDEVTPTTMVWLRLAASTAILLVIARPRLSGHSRADWLVVLAYGTSLATMNWAIYQSFARMPLGLAVTIEFLGPLTVALLTSRRRLDLAWVLLAAAGVSLLGFRDSEVTLAGVLFALLAAAAWGAYIPLSAATGRGWPGLSGLAVGSVVGAVAFAPYVVGTAGDALLDPKVVGIGLVVAVMSSVLPYSFEMAALRIMPAKVFGILMSLEPAAAALAGFVLLHELLDLTQWFAVACVIAASIGVTRSAQPQPAPN